ncbi:S1 RNA-binding domain-containing protein [Faecalibaculum rodentium]|jgi:small subunit ribosomal protein S1|uniref:S1 RNA-binding domain-containing protein n=1 Tax=Faecalibaculum rodentium TaxID=1702221 RepID=UPI0025AD4C75|nr:S1 RNA-binding domain-containing protein [Faecalibaculum rodentium]
MPRKTKTEETVVTEENILHENDMETENVPDAEETGLDGENPDTLNVDAGTDSSAAEESAETSTPAEPVSTEVESAGEDASMEETLPEETAVPDEPGSNDAIPDGQDNKNAIPDEAATEPAAETAGSPEAPSAKPASKPARKRTRASAAKTEAPAAPAPVKKTAPSSILTLSADAEVETPESREDTIWHELQNAYRTRKILTGTLGGIEKMEGGGTIAVVYYKEMRIVIPLAEMMINLVEDAAHDYGELVQRQNKILGNMLGCEIDFIIKGLDNASRSVVASRKDAMYKKRQIFYLPDASGNSRVCEDRIVQARVIAVAEKVVRVEIFGTECSILARDLSWDWMGDATERFHVGEQILVRILSVKLRSLEDISVKADVKSVNGNTSKENLSKCKIQGKYAGTVTDIHKGTVFVRLHIGVNAVAHSCYDNRMPGKKDDVSFVVTRIDADRNVAVGLISRIIKQNI